MLMLLNLVRILSSIAYYSTKTGFKQASFEKTANSLFYVILLIEVGFAFWSVILTPLKGTETTSVNSSNELF